MFSGLTLVNTAGWCISKLLREQKRHSGKRDSPANAGDTRDMDWIPGSGRSPGEGSGNPLSILAWEITWTEEPGELQFMGVQRVRHDFATELY